METFFLSLQSHQDCSTSVLHSKYIPSIETWNNSNAVWIITLTLKNPHYKHHRLEAILWLHDKSNFICWKNSAVSNISRDSDKTGFPHFWRKKIHEFCMIFPGLYFFSDTIHLNTTSHLAFQHLLRMKRLKVETCGYHLQKLQAETDIKLMSNNNSFLDTYNCTIFLQSL